MGLVAVTHRFVRSPLAAGLLLAACSKPAPPTTPASDMPSAAPTAAGSGGSAAGAGHQPVPDFANRIWKVAKGSAGDPGTFYVFLSDGSMLITSPHGTPALGSWHYSGEVLTLVEEGLPHQATVLQATLDTLAIRIAGSGQPVAMTFVPATGTVTGK
jgi:hypothetical protein